MSFLGRLQAPIAGLLGVGVGVGVMLLVEARSARPSPPTTASPPSEPAPRMILAPPSDDPTTQRRLDDLEAQMRDLAKTRAQFDAGAPPTAEEREAAVARFARDFDREVAVHQSEPRDNAWATPKERAISGTIERMAAKPGAAFSLVAVDCRTTSCVAQLQWPSEGAARAGLHDLLNSSGDIGCARQISLPPASGAAEYRASMLIDCTDSM